MTKLYGTMTVDEIQELVSTLEAQGHKADDVKLDPSVLVGIWNELKEVKSRVLFYEHGRFIVDLSQVHDLERSIPAKFLVDFHRGVEDQKLLATAKKCEECTPITRSANSLRGRVFFYSTEQKNEKPTSA
jgi:hypothetical protein